MALHSSNSIHGCLYIGIMPLIYGHGNYLDTQAHSVVLAAVFFDCGIAPSNLMTRFRLLLTAPHRKDQSSGSKKIESIEAYNHRLDHLRAFGDVEKLFC